MLYAPSSFSHSSRIGSGNSPSTNFDSASSIGSHTGGWYPAFGGTSPGFAGVDQYASSLASTRPLQAFGSWIVPTPCGSPPGTSPFAGTLSTTPEVENASFGQSGFGWGSKKVPYSSTSHFEGDYCTKFESISAMPVYKDKSHEELRCEDYLLGTRGRGSNAAVGQSTNAFSLGVSPAQASAFTSSSPLGHWASNSFSTATPSSAFAPSDTGASLISTGFESFPSPFTLVSNPAEGYTPSTGFISSPSNFGTTHAFNGFNTEARQSSPLFPSRTPSLGQTSSPLGHNSSLATFISEQQRLLRQQINASGDGRQTSSAFGQNPAPSQSSPFSTPSTGLGFKSTPFSSSQTSAFDVTTSSTSTPYQSVQPGQTSGSFSFAKAGQPLSGGCGCGSFGNICEGPSVKRRPSPFGQPTNAALFATPISTSIGSSPSIVCSTPAQGSKPASSVFNTVGTQSSPLFNSTAPSLGQTSSPFGQNSSALRRTCTPGWYGNPPSYWSGMQNGFANTPFPSRNTSSFSFNTASHSSDQSTNVTGVGTSTTESSPFTLSSSPFGQPNTLVFRLDLARAQPNELNIGVSFTPTLNTSSCATRTYAFGCDPSPSPFGTSSASAFGSSPSMFGSSFPLGPAPVPANCPMFQSAGPSCRQTNSPFGQQTSPGFGQQASPRFGQQASPGFGFGQQPSPGFRQQASPGFGFGQQTSPGFGQRASPGFGFGQQASPGFGQRASPGSGQQASPGFGQQASSGSGQNPAPQLSLSVAPSTVNGQNIITLMAHLSL